MRNGNGPAIRLAAMLLALALGDVDTARQHLCLLQRPWTAAEDKLVMRLPPGIAARYVKRTPRAVELRRIHLGLVAGRWPQSPLIHIAVLLAYAGIAYAICVVLARKRFST